jgi:hypothetical protein
MRFLRSSDRTSTFRHIFKFLADHIREATYMHLLLAPPVEICEDGVRNNDFVGFYLRPVPILCQ